MTERTREPSILADRGFVRNTGLFVQIQKKKREEEKGRGGFENQKSPVVAPQESGKGRMLVSLS